MEQAAVTHLPTEGVWRRFLLLIPLTIVLAVGSYLHVRSVAGTYETFGRVMHEPGSLTNVDVTMSNDGVVEVVEANQTPLGNVHVVFRALADGETVATVGTPTSNDIYFLRVEKGAVIEGGINYSGWRSVHLCFCILLAAICLLFASVLARLWKSSWYGYTMVACGGGLLFCLFQLLFFLMLLLRGSLRNFSDLVFGLTSMADLFVLATFVPVSVLMLLVSFSNVSLIRHEGLRPVNLLGVIVGILWTGALVVWYKSADTFTTFFSPRFVRILDVLVATGITFGECLLISTIACAWLASHHTPRKAADYLVILGCGIRKDGTPCPLLAGRVDRALAFDERRTAAGDRPATFVPSGGQGPDEVVSEAQSMGTYLQGKGVEASRIVLEDRSTTTRENMAFSREVIERHAGRDASELSVAFSTTNYHVFRGYVCAHQAGMVVEGLGSKTRAYFWPNAFLREFAGLLAAQWRTILQVYVIIAFVYGIAAYAMSLLA